MFDNISYDEKHNRTAYYSDGWATVVYWNGGFSMSFEWPYKPEQGRGVCHDII